MGGEFTSDYCIIIDKGKGISGLLGEVINQLIPKDAYGKYKETDHNKTRKSDEAHFWLNGYVNKQNCRIWSEANPQVYVETPLHPEKLTVWCALWAGGILLQKR
ncbi:hypothetical protein TNCV_201931 [Trichonephila clavipes]|nr:hypothetical protein TNCV_201931 [Trichonephila clavipes]